MTVVPYKAEHMMRLELQEGQGYCKPTLDEKYAKMLENQYAFTALDGEKVLAVAGVTEIWDNRALVWSFLSKDAGPYMLRITRAVQRVLSMVPYKRLEADTPCEFSAGHRWLRVLGFEMEAYRMKAHRPDGGDSALYARVS